MSEHYACGCEVNYHGTDRAPMACPTHGKWRLPDAPPATESEVPSAHEREEEIDDCADPSYAATVLAELDVARMRLMEREKDLTALRTRLQALEAQMRTFRVQPIDEASSEIAENIEAALAPIFVQFANRLAAALRGEDR